MTGNDYYKPNTKLSWLVIFMFIERIKEKKKSGLDSAVRLEDGQHYA
jgi:hypothetical protein